VAKRKKRRIKRRKPAEAPANPEVVLRRAEGQLAEGNPKRAREGFRRLFKLDPDCYRDRYVEVTLLVIERALSEGRPKEARQLLNHLEEIGTEPSQLRALQTKAAVELGEPGAAAEAAAELVESGDEAERIEAADALVLARAEQAGAVCEAISHLCRGEWDEMKAALQGIGRRSPFAHWRLFLRGCAAYYRADPREAERCFRRLPPGSLPARKSGAFKVLEGDWQGVDERRITEACLLSGEPVLAKLLPAAQGRWLSKRFMDAYRVLKRERAPFPCLEVSPWGQLTRFFQLADMEMTGREKDVWIPALLKLLPLGGRVEPGCESYLVCSAALREMVGGWEERSIGELLWPLYVDSRERLLGSSARFVAMSHFARALHEEPEEFIVNPFWPGSMSPSPAEFEPAIRALKAAIDADPSFQDAPLKLLSVYRRLRRRSEANRLLDQMTKRFPDSKEVLFEAGRACLDRKAHAKGLKYLGRARELDPVDPGIRAEIRRGLREKAVAHFRKGGEAQLAKGRGAFEELLASVPHHPGPDESRGFLLIQWSVLEELANGSEAPLAREKYAESASDVPPDVAQFYRAVQHEVFGAGSRRGRSTSPAVRLPAPSPREAELSQALQIFKLWMKLEKDFDGAAPIPVMFWIEQYARAAARKLRREDRGLVLQLVTQMRHAGRFWEDLAGEIILKQLKKDRRDPHLQCMAWIYGQRPPPTPAQLQEAVAEAVRRGDRDALEAIRRFEEMLPQARARRPGEPPPEEAVLDADAGLDGVLEEEIEGMPEGMLDALFEFSHDERVEELIEAGVDRRQAEIIADMIETLLEECGGAPPGSRPRGGTRSGSGPRRGGSQLDLPF